MVYDMILPALPFLGGYIFTYTLYKLNIINKSFHINIWNFIIGIAFLISGGAGFILVFLIEFSIKLPISPELLYWHVELGITLVIVTIFHIHSYWRSARAMFMVRRSRA